MNIGLDLDGVLYDWHLAVYNEFVVYSNETRDIRTFWKEIGNELTLLQWDSLCKLEHLYSQIPPRSGVVKFVQDLAKDNSIYYLTKRPKEVQFTTDRYLRRYGYPSPENLFLTDSSKRQLLIDLKIDLFVEDRIHFIEEAADLCSCFIVTQPWNEDFYDERVTRIDSILDLRDILWLL